MNGVAKLQQAQGGLAGYNEPMMPKPFESQRRRATNADDAEPIEPIAQAGANIFIFTPAITIAVLYGGMWLMLWLAGLAESLLGRIAFALFVLAPPLLLARAFLKFYSAGLALTDEDVLIAPGWPHQTGIEVTIDAVDRVELKRSKLAQYFGAADVRIHLKDDTLIKVPDLDRPDRIVRMIASRIGQNAATV